MIPVPGHVVRIAGGQCASDDMAGGWVQGMGARSSPALGHPTQRAWPNNGLRSLRLLRRGISF